MRDTAGIAAVERPRGRSLLAWGVVAVLTALLFALLGLVSFRAWTPEVGVLVLLALALRGDARPLWMGAVVVSVARIGVGVDPPTAVLFGYLSVAFVHASLCALIDPDRLLLRSLVAGLYGSGFSAWLLVAHEVRNPGALVLGAHVGDLVACGIGTGLAAFVLVPLLRRVPGVVPRRARSGGSFRGPRWMRGVPAGRSA